jgi:hypothetical protein
MRLSHGSSALSATFDDPNLVSVAGLAPVVALAQDCRLGDLVAEKVTLQAQGGVNARLKVPALVAGMVAGADSIDDMDVLRHGGMDRLFAGIRAPSTLGTFLRSFTFGHVRQLDSVAAGFLTALAAAAPLLPGAGQVTYLDFDDTMRETHGYAKQGAGYGYTKVKGLNALLATICTPTAAPLIAASRLRKGAVNSARGAGRLVTEALTTARACGAGGPDRGGLVIARADSAFYCHDVVTAARRGGAHFSITARMNPAVRRAIGVIGEDAWIPIRYPQAIWDEEGQCWILRRRGRRDRLHRVHLPAQGRPHHRPADRPPGQAAEPRLGAGRTGRAVHRLALPRDLHRLPAAHAGRREDAPAARAHRAGQRRPQGRAAGPPALRIVRGELGLVGAGRDRVQPHPRRRRPGLDLPRQGHHRHHPHPAHRRPGAAGPLRSPTAAAPAPRLALGDRLDPAVRRHLRPTCSGLTDHRPTGPDRRPSVEEPDRPANRSRPHPANKIRSWPVEPTKIDGGSRLKRPGSGRGSDLARRLKPCQHPASTTRRPARTVRMHQERLRDLSESKLTARRAVGAVLDINPATLRNWVGRAKRSTPAPDPA